jgi:hypothetical protein
MRLREGTKKQKIKQLQKFLVFDLRKCRSPADLVVVDPSMDNETEMRYREIGRTT